MAPKSTLSVVISADVRMSTFCARKYSQNSLQIIMTEFPEFYYYIKLFSAHPQRRLIVCQPRLCHDLTPTEKGANPHHRLSPLVHVSCFNCQWKKGQGDYLQFHPQRPRQSNITPMDYYSLLRPKNPPS